MNVVLATVLCLLSFSSLHVQAQLTCGTYKSSDNRYWNLASIPTLSGTDAGGWTYQIGTCGICASSGITSLACQDGIRSLGSTASEVITNVAGKALAVATTGGTVDWGCSTPRSSTVFINCTSTSTSQIVGIRGGCGYELDVAVPYSICGCPNRCSGRGSCVSGSCVCNSPFVGVDCANGTTCTTYTNPIDQRTWLLSSIPTFTTSDGTYSYQINFCGVSGCTISGSASPVCQTDGANYQRSLGAIQTAVITPTAANQITIRVSGGLQDWGCGVPRSSTIVLNCASVSSPTLTVSGGCQYSFVGSIPLAYCS